MRFISWLDDAVTRLRWYHIPLTKLAVFFATLMLLVLFAPFREFLLGVEWYVYLLLMLAVSIPVMARIL